MQFHHRAIPEAPAQLSPANWAGGTNEIHIIVVSVDIIRTRRKPMGLLG